MSLWRQVCFLYVFVVFQFLLFCHRFVITLEELDEGEDIAHCPSCTLKIRVIFEEEDIQKYLKATGSKED
jgi:hypothetical protein